MVLAHSGGHWSTQLIYLIPVIVLVAALGRAAIRDRRHGDPPPDDEPTLDEIMQGPR